MKKINLTFLLTMLLCMVGANAFAHSFYKGDGSEDATSFYEFISHSVAETGNTFVLKDRKLGPVTLGKPVRNLPKLVNGLYDNFKYRKIKHQDEMDGDWTEEYYLFTLKGKEIFRANIDGGVVSSIEALSGSANIIKTPAGWHVGSSARELFKQPGLNWYTEYCNEVYAEKGSYTLV